MSEKAKEPADDPRRVGLRAMVHDAEKSGLYDQPEASTADVTSAVEVGAGDVATQKAADKNRPACPHCGRLLRPEHDLGDHLHCDGAPCIECCFDPGPDGPVLRANYPACPAAGR